MVTTKAKNILFICTGNSARSIMAEVLANYYGKGNYRAFSAGAAPAGKVNPLTIETLRSRGLPTDGLRSKSLKEFLHEKFDTVVTVCDKARESCPVWPGDTEVLHWSFDDPAAYEGDDSGRKAAFEDTLDNIEKKILDFFGLLEDKRSS